MKYDVFFSICQTETDGYTPDEKTMLANFMDQVRLADELEYGVAWVAETHLSCQVQKQNPGAVIPDFKGEIGLNTDILQVAHKVFSQTQNIEVGSAIRNIQCNGGPIAHAEAVKTFLSLHGLDDSETRRLHLGFAAGRFPFSVTPYGIRPRNLAENAAWPVLKNKVFQTCTEIFLRLLNNENLSSRDVEKPRLNVSDFAKPEMWDNFIKEYEVLTGTRPETVEFEHFWNFEKVGVIPYEGRQDLLNLVLGSHDPATQKLANEIRPVGVFNLSITPSEVVEQTHKKMSQWYHPDGGPWQRHYMPRTCLIFLDEDSNKAKQKARAAWTNYWKAMEGTLDPAKVEKAVANAIAGHPEEIAMEIKDKYHPEDRLMLWFDFNNHDNEDVKHSMRLFKERVIPMVES